MNRSPIWFIWTLSSGLHLLISHCQSTRAQTPTTIIACLLLLENRGRSLAVVCFFRYLRWCMGIRGSMGNVSAVYWLEPDLAPRFTHFLTLVNRRSWLKKMILRLYYWTLLLFCYTSIMVCTISKATIVFERRMLALFRTVLWNSLHWWQFTVAQLLLSTWRN